MRSVRPDRRQVELRRLGNQLSVLGKDNSLCKIVKCCVFCLFVKLRLSPGCVGPVADQQRGHWGLGPPSSRGPPNSQQTMFFKT